MNRVAIIGTNGLPAKYGGFETLTNHLVEHIDKTSFEVIVYCSKTPKKDRIKNYKGAKLIYFPFKANGWQSIIYDFVTILHAFLNSKNLIILGFSGAFAFPFNKIFKRNIIFNIGGIEWQKVRGAKISSKLEVRLKKFMEKLCVNNSNTVIIDNKAFEDYIKKEYGRVPILAEYGGDHAKKIQIDSEIKEKFPFLGSKYMLTVSRAQEDMNIHVLLKAFEGLKEHKLVVISNWNISEYGKKLFARYKDNYENIILLNAIYDFTELNTIRSNAFLYIHSHSLCGTAPSLVEAMSLALPIVCFDVATNRYTTEQNSYYFKNSDELCSIITSLDGNKIVKLRDEMAEIAKRRYQWKRVSNIYFNNLKID